MEDMSLISDNPNSSRSDNIAFVNNCMCEVCLNGDTLSKYLKIIEKFFPNEPDLYGRLETVANTINELASQQKPTQTSISNVKYLAKEAFINEQTVDHILDAIAERKRQQAAKKLQEEEEAARKLEEEAFMSKYSWGACGLTFIWGNKFGDKLTYFAPLVFFLLTIVSVKLAFLGLCIFMIWVGWKARQRVWNNNDQMMPSDFMKAQKKWDVTGMVFFAVTLLLALLG